MRKLGLAAVVVLAGLAGAARGEGVEVISVKKIWDAGGHNAFTDLIWFKGKWFCVCRESAAHVGGNGKIRVLSSADGEKWESVAAVEEEGIDLRDPKLSETPDGRLMLVMGGSVYEGKKLVGRRPRVAFSKDGVEWGRPVKVLGEGDWLWRVTWNDGVAWGTSYRPKAGGKEWSLTLYRSGDGVAWERVTELGVPGRPNETTLRFLKDGTMVALVRREAGDQKGWVGVGKGPAYTEWTWKELGQRLGGPNFVVLPGGEMVAGSRVYGERPRMGLARLTAEGGWEPLGELPSGGDCSYPGMVWREGVLWVSYYSSHEGKAGVYLAKVRGVGEGTKAGQ